MKKSGFHFGMWLRREIENRMMTQPQFSRVSGIPFSSLRLWITDDTPRMSGLSIARLAKALGIKRTLLEEKIRMASSDEHGDRKRAG